MNEPSGSSEAEGRPSIAGTIGTMLGLGVVLAWASIYVIPWLQGLGLAPGLAQNVPFAALVFGAGWGFALRVSKRAREALTFVVMPIATGVLFWVFGLLLGALLLLFGAERIADFAPTVGFWLGLLLGVGIAIAIGVEGLRGMFSNEK